MKAIAQTRYGGPEVLAVTEVPDPLPGPGQVLVEVRAAAVNAADWHLMRGEPRVARLDVSMFGLRAPRQRVRGSDFAGVVRAVGSEVSGFAPGDEVFGEGSGSFAQLVVAKAGATARKPADLSFEEAATLPMAGTTALQLLRAGEAEKDNQGRRVAINGASGGVGTFAIQLAVASGAHVTAVCSARNGDQARALGADDVVDYARDDFTERAPYDVVVDLVGNRSLRDLRHALSPKGTLVLSGGGISGEGRYVGPLGLMARAKLVPGPGSTAIPLATANTADLDELAALMAAGTIRTAIERTFAMDEAADAIDHLEREHARGKIVLTGW